MKTNLHFVLLFIIPYLSYSQTTISKIIYFDSIWKESTEDNYNYYRIIKDYYSDKDIYSIFDYYKSGVLEMEGASTDKDHLIKEGQFVYYYENGNRKTVLKYIKSEPSGKEYNWHENGKIKSEIEYIKNKKEATSVTKINQYWNTENTQKVIDGNGDYEDLNEGFFESGKIKNGLHDGNWKGSNKRPKYTYVESYEDGKLISGASVDSVNFEHQYKSINTQPVPKKGIKHFYKHIGQSMNISVVGKNIVVGKIYLTFVIEADGRVNEIKIIKGLGYGIDEEAIRVVQNYKDWIPGKTRGIPTRVPFSVPITISAQY